MRIDLHSEKNYFHFGRKSMKAYFEYDDQHMSSIHAKV